MAREIIGVRIGAQHRAGLPDEWIVTYSENGRGVLIHTITDAKVRSSIDALEVAKRELGIENP